MNVLVIAAHPIDEVVGAGGTSLRLGRELVRECLPRLADGTAPRIPQDHSLATYWPRRGPADGLLNWKATARAVYDLVRASTRPYPGAFTYHEGRKVTVWSARMGGPVPPGSVAGEMVEITSAGVRVATGDGCVLLTSLESDVAGEERADELARRWGWRPGDRFCDGAPAGVSRT